jgi:hypothetical protein
MHCAGWSVKSIVRGEEPSGFGQGVLPYAAVSGVVDAAVVVVALAALVVVEFAVDTSLLSLPSCEKANSATTSTTTMIATLRIVLLRFDFCSAWRAASSRACRPAFWRILLLVAMEAKTYLPARCPDRRARTASGFARRVPAVAGFGDR